MGIAYGNRITGEVMIQYGKGSRFYQNSGSHIHFCFLYRAIFYKQC